MHQHQHQHQDLPESEAPSSEQLSAPLLSGESLQAVPLDSTEQTVPAVLARQETAKAGRAGERNLRVESVPVWVNGHRPSYEIVSSLEEHPLEVLVEQLSYRKHYQGRGRVQTQVIPVVPIGTPGRLLARDLQTGEELEVTWRWVPLHEPSWLGRWLGRLAGWLFGRR
jgi:hypothetical protein